MGGTRKVVWICATKEYNKCTGKLIKPNIYKYECNNLTWTRFAGILCKILVDANTIMFAALIEF
jgi:hypothetical protein